MISAQWLRAVIKGLLRLALRIYYRSVQVQGLGRLPTERPVLLVANHPGSLLDPALLVCLLSRQVRFGAKHTLFRGPFRLILEAFGAIPLFRAQDDRRAMRQNLQAFERYAALLRDGHVTAIFPEGVTQDTPHLAPVKTGAARIALKARPPPASPWVLWSFPSDCSLSRAGVFAPTCSFGSGTRSRSATSPRCTRRPHAGPCESSPAASRRR